jgi:methionine aminopeptidase
VQGVLSHQLKKHIIDGSQTILNCETAEEKVEDVEFGMNEVYCLDLVMSTGEGKPKETELRTTVYKRALENSYTLKTQKARQFLAEVGKRFPTLPFSLRAFDETVGRVGVSEANRHELLHSYPVLQEKPSEFVAHFKYTVLLLPGGTKKITGVDFTQAAALPTAGPVKDEEVLKLLMTSAKPKKNKKKKAKEVEGATEE